MAQWPLIELDLHQFYGIDTADGCLDARSWRWLAHRITGLFTIEHSRLRVKFYPSKQQQAPARRGHR
ncbi:hypothetical protein GCM10023259_103760 [Thermocatellispora tengchongensis]|uniref:hypothetical protein n=1 Tax=Thermocatellispora tengchongensis TaxID=1073253 RepID=UPI0031EBA168